MDDQQHFDFCILGAGLAGLSLADALQERDYSVNVIEKHSIAAGASGTPGGLVNPATGRRGRKSWKAEACYKAIHANLQKVQSYAQQPFFYNNGLLRPALTQKMSRKMKSQFDQTFWRPGWCYWLSEKAVKQKHPGINCVGGGLWLPIALTVDVGAYLEAYTRYLTDKKVSIQTGSAVDVTSKGNRWIIEGEKGRYTSQNLVDATGFGTLKHPFWKKLDLFAVKGQVAHFRSKTEPLSFTHSVSGMGYIARLGDEKTFIQGSTYEHDFSHLSPDQEGVHYLHARLKKMLPALAHHTELISQWAGVRISTPNRKPVLGSHPAYKGLHLFTGLGSKGLLYSKFLANHFADYLHTESSLYEEVSIERMV